MTSKTEMAVELDWSRLLGFDQVARATSKPVASAMVGGKVKAPIRGLAGLGAKVGAKLGVKTSLSSMGLGGIGAKVGVKPKPPQ